MKLKRRKSAKKVLYQLCIKVIAGQKVTMLIDSGATHNFIDDGLVIKGELMTANFEGSNVIVVDGFTMPCLKVI